MSKYLFALLTIVFLLLLAIGPEAQAAGNRLVNPGGNFVGGSDTEIAGQFLPWYLRPSVPVARAPQGPESPAAGNRTVRISVGPAGIEADAFSRNGTVSRTGRYVAFASPAQNLTGDPMGELHILLRDRDSDNNGGFDEPNGATTALASKAAGGGFPNGASFQPAISDDGRYIAYASYASNIASGNTGGFSEVYVYDRIADQTRRVSISSAGAPADGNAAAPSISADGRFVAFRSSATNLVGAATNGFDHIFVHDRDADEDGVFDEAGAIATVLVSRGEGGAALDAGAMKPQISGDGRHIIYSSSATNAVAGDTNGVLDVFAYDMNTGVTTRVSVAADGTQGNDHSGDPGEDSQDISHDGRFVVFGTKATNLSAGATGRRLVYLHDRDTDGDGVFDEAGAIATFQVAAERFPSSLSWAGSPAISANGQRVAFYYYSGQGSNGQIYVYDRPSDSATMYSVSIAGEPANFDPRYPDISADGNQVVYESIADNLAETADTNGENDIFASVSIAPTPTLPPYPWQPETLDVYGDSGSWTSMALDSKGHPHISYIVQEAQGLRSVLKYAYWDGVMWVFETVDDSARFSEGTAIALDQQDRPHISYHQIDDRDLKYAFRGENGWTTSTVDTGGDVGRQSAIVVNQAGEVHITYLDLTHNQLRHAARLVGRWQYDIVGPIDALSGGHGLAVNSAGAPFVAFYDPTLPGLRYGNWTGSGWNLTTVDTLGNAGRFASLAMDSSDRPHISYLGGTSGKNLYYATNNGSWAIELVETNIDSYSSLALDSSGSPAISFFTGSELWVARRTPGGGWSIEVADAPGVGRFNTLKFDANDVPHIAYYDTGFQDLKYVHALPAWQFRTVAAGAGERSPTIALRQGAPGVGFYREIASPPSFLLRERNPGSWAERSIGAIGDRTIGSDLVYDGNDQPTAAYYDEFNRNLLFARFDGDAWLFEEIVKLPAGTTMGDKIELLPGPDGQPRVAYSYVHGVGASIVLAERQGNGSWQRQEFGFAGETQSPVWDAAVAPSGDITVAYGAPNQSALHFARWDGSSWQTSVVIVSVEATDIAMTLENRITLDGPADVFAIAFYDSANGQVQYVYGDDTGPFGSWLQARSIPVIPDVKELDLALAFGSAQNPRLALLMNDDSLRALGSDAPLTAAWTQEAIAAGGVARSHLSLAFEDRERLVYQEGTGASSQVIHAFRASNSGGTASAQTAADGFSIGKLYSGECMCWLPGAAPECWSAYELPGSLGSGRALASSATSDAEQPVLRRLTALFTQTAEGQAFIDLYAQHDFELGKLLVSDPALAWDSYRALYNFMPGLEALIDGRGRQVVVTQEMVDDAYDIWTRLAAAGSPDLANTINTKLAAYSNLQDFAGRPFYDWGVAIGLTPPDNTLYLPIVHR